MALIPYWNIKNIVLISGVLVTQLLFGQFNTFSPFSRYGIGDIQETTLSYQKGMSNVGIALPIDTTAPLFLNITNPATLSQLRLTSIEASAYYYTTQLVNKQNYKVQQKSTNFQSFVIGFPIKKFSGFSFGLMPYSFVGYQINQNVLTDNIGTINYVYEGSGGLNKVFAAYGFAFKKFFKKQDSIQRPLKSFFRNLSLGLNAYYLFGELSNIATVNYPSNTTYYNFVNDQRYRIKGISADFGLHSYWLLNQQNNSTLNIGLTFSNPSSLKAINDYIAYNFSYTYFGEKYIVDTLLYSENQAGNLHLPVTYGLGMAYVVANKWGLGIDLKYTDWEKFYLVSPSRYGRIKNNIEINVGGYVQPDRFITSKGNYLKKIIYRYGIGYNTAYQEFQGKAVPLFNVSAGISLPMGLYRAFSALHLSAQYIVKGQKDAIIRENIFKLNLGITLNDRWFIKYKYD